ncbi:hypothetical protein [Nocardia sp. NPDC057440]|uniref:hypothetical protein n=1 Tax=Nocardia sp. NPDC057440 TaxID=3346134 RepID=UPI00366BA15D
MLAATLIRLTERINTAVTKVSGTLRQNVYETTGNLGLLAKSLVSEDARYARALQKFERRERANPAEFFGYDATTGELRFFTSDRIRSGPIRDPDDNIVGVNFPSKPRDGTGPAIFTPEGYAAVHRDYYRGLYSRGNIKVIKNTRFLAPWAKKKPEDPDPELVFSRAHANGDEYAIEVNIAEPGASEPHWVKVGVNGSEFGWILASNEHFKQAARNKPTAQLIQFSCAPASGSAARQSAQSLQSAGIGFHVWSTKETHFSHHIEDAEKTGFIIINDHGTEMKVDDFGNPKESPWEVFEAPRNTPERPA